MVKHSHPLSTVATCHLNSSWKAQTQALSLLQKPSWTALTKACKHTCFGKILRPCNKSVCSVALEQEGQEAGLRPQVPPSIRRCRERQAGAVWRALWRTELQCRCQCAVLHRRTNTGSWGRWASQSAPAQKQPWESRPFSVGMATRYCSRKPFSLVANFSTS